MYELLKREKKIAREVIEKGLLIEFANALNDAGVVLEKWKNKVTNNRASYHSLFQTIMGHDKHIARRYDGMRGSDYIRVISCQLADGLISEDDLKEFSKEGQERIISFCRFLKEEYNK